MSESEFIKGLKKWFWSFLLGQLALVIVAGAVFYGSINVTVSQTVKDIDELKETKADLQTVLRIKADTDIKDAMILEQLKEINDGQAQLYQLLVNHMQKDVK